MKLTRLAAMGAVTIALAFAFAAPAAATDNAKWFVCKYVGTPGVDESLQTGNNPISVSEDAIPVSPVVAGEFFQDSQGRSYVLVEDTGQDEPDPSECPPPTVPEPTPTPTPEATPTPTPEATPTPTPEPTPTPTPEPTPTPSPTPTPRQRRRGMEADRRGRRPGNRRSELRSRLGVQPRYRRDHHRQRARHG